MKTLNRAIYSWINKKFMDGCSDYNTLDVRKSCRTKEQAREAFAENGIPHAQGMKFFNPFKAIRFAREHGFPLVVKPNVSGYSRGSHFPINSYKDLWKAIFFARLWWPTSIVEKYLRGKNYRVVVVENEIMSVIRRYPPFITGDGKSTISQLIDKENAIRRDMKLTPVMHVIEKNSKIKRFLKRQQLTLDSVPESGREVELYNKIALAPGGIVETINQSKVTPKNKELFLKLLKTFNANIFGIDVIMEQGIDVDYDAQNCILLEINSRPYLKMHHYPRFGGKPDLTPYYNKLNTIQLADSGVF